MAVGTGAWHCELAWLGGEQPVADVRIEAVDGAIAAVEPGAERTGDATVLAGLTLPGLANAHSHAFHRALRGRTQRGSGTFWTWRDDMYRLAAVLDPDSYHALARATFAEMIVAGITCVGEFHYVHHQLDGSSYADPNAIGQALVTAASDAGVRITLLDTCYLGSGIGADGVLQPPIGPQQRFTDGDAGRWSERAAATLDWCSTTVRVGAAVHSMRAVDPRSAGQVAAWAGEHGVPLHAHVSEQPAENAQCHTAYGASPVEVMARHGVLSDRFTAVHATHLDPADVALLARAGAGVCMCPTTERDLADGIGPTRAFGEEGVAMCLGSDSHAVIDLFEEARAVELDERLRSGERGTHDAVSLLTMATEHGYLSLGWPGGGRIAVGAPADLTTVTLRSVRTAGTTTATAIPTAVFAATAADVTDVVVGGEQIVVGGRHRRVDVAAELESAIARVWEAVT